jgi:small-conductance mechanosensitive channel
LDINLLRDFVANLVVIFVVNIFIPSILALFVLLIGTRLVRIIAGIASAVARRSRVKSTLVDLIGASITAMGWVLVVAAVFQSLHLDAVALAVGGSLSLAALGVATAASGNLGDIIAGVFLASDPDFGTGFTIRSGDILGTIEHIDLRKTRIRAADGKLHVLPNKDVESKVWIVEDRPPEPNNPTPTFHIPAFFRRPKPAAGQAPSVGTPPAAPIPPTTRPQ